MAGALAGAAAVVVGFWLTTPDVAYAAAKKTGDSDDAADAICDMDTGEAATAGKKPDSNGSSALRAFAGGTCFTLSGSVQLTGQATDSPEPRPGQPLVAPRIGKINPYLRLETARHTSHGALKTAFEIDWSYATDTGPDSLPTLDEMTVSLAGFTLGYAASLMGFWDSETFEFTASAPNRSSYLFSYEHGLGAALKLAVAVEAGPPTTRGASTWDLPDTPPYYTTRLRYEKDDWTLHASAAVHEVDTRGAVLLGLPAESRVGWAASAGIKIPFSFIAEDDAFSSQVSYAVDSLIFLGTATDVSFLAAHLPTTGPTRGWSAVASYSHNWTEKWASIVFASYLTLDAELFLTRPSVQTKRYGVNLTYQPIDNLTLGFEVDGIDALIEINGPLGIIPDIRVKGHTAFLWIKRDF